jgi:methylmalonyl-CoA carboxyltransferase small subunit
LDRIRIESPWNAFENPRTLHIHFARELKLKLRLTVDGKVYEVDVEVLEQDQERGPVHAAARSSAHTTTAVEIKPPASSAGVPAGPADENKVFRSPISGMIVRVPVSIGQEVQANEVLMVLEAMKMETVVSSLCDGKITRIHGQAGDSVQVKQILVEFE